MSNDRWQHNVLQGNAADRRNLLLPPKWGPNRPPNSFRPPGGKGARPKAEKIRAIAHVYAHPFAGHTAGYPSVRRCCEAIAYTASGSLAIARCLSHPFTTDAVVNGRVAGAITPLPGYRRAAGFADRFGQTGARFKTGGLRVRRQSPPTIRKWRWSRVDATAQGGRMKPLNP